MKVRASNYPFVKKKTTKIRKSMPNYTLKITKVLRALLVSATHLLSLGNPHMSRDPSLRNAGLAPRVSSASEFVHSLSWQPTRTFKPHTRAIHALEIVPSSHITLIKV